MSVQQARSGEPYEVIRLGGEALEDGEIEAALAGHDDWVRSGRPGARPHYDVMAELLAGQ
jgi:hypothetical protein